MGCTPPPPPKKKTKKKKQLSGSTSPPRSWPLYLFSPSYLQHSYDKITFHQKGVLGWFLHIFMWPAYQEKWTSIFRTGWQQNVSDKCRWTDLIGIQIFSHCGFLFSLDPIIAVELRETTSKSPKSNQKTFESKWEKIYKSSHVFLRFSRFKRVSWYVLRVSCQVAGLTLRIDQKLLGRWVGRGFGTFLGHEIFWGH